MGPKLLKNKVYFQTICHAYMLAHLGFVTVCIILVTIAAIASVKPMLSLATRKTLLQQWYSRLLIYYEDYGRTRRWRAKLKSCWGLVSLNKTLLIYSKTHHSGLMQWVEASESLWYSTINYIELASSSTALEQFLHSVIFTLAYITHQEDHSTDTIAVYIYKRFQYHPRAEKYKLPGSEMQLLEINYFATDDREPYDSTV